MNDILLSLLVLPSIAIALWCLWLDWDVSKRFIYYSQKESTGWLQNDEGYMSHTAVVIMSAIKLSPFLLFFTPFSTWVALWGPLIGLPHMIVAFSNRKHSRAYRLTQITKFKWLRGAADDMDDLVRKFNKVYQSKKTKSWYLSICHWIRIPAPDSTTATRMCVTELKALVRKDPDTWFPDTKFNPEDDSWMKNLPNPTDYEFRPYAFHLRRGDRP
jgi:hypothetical protein